MTRGYLNWMASYIRNVADDVPQGVYVCGKYSDVILPMTLVQRLDAVIEPSKDAVAKPEMNLDATGTANNLAFSAKPRETHCQKPPFSPSDTCSPFPGNGDRKPTSKRCFRTLGRRKAIL